uniref:Uracil-DNA glycosylase n=1 Tax=Leporid herpesvirus 1 TaxID=46017 RepID=Q69273_9GAMA|nr:uracil-DNA glycosylase [Leporid herpesvirus 1]
MDYWIQKNIFNDIENRETCVVSDAELMLAPSWITFLDLSPFLKQKLANLLREINNMRNQATIYPPQDKIMYWSSCCSPDNVKVVILGQDPYHGGQATGLAFSVDHGVQIPPSLKNIFSELYRGHNGHSMPVNGCLDGWARQGVLLLNSILTVERGRASSHNSLGWQWFTNYILTVLSEKSRYCVFLLWGSKAIDKGNLIDSKHHLVLKAQHPSPLSVCNQRSSLPAFFGCDHFRKANDYLIAHDRSPIDWWKSS